MNRKRVAVPKSQAVRARANAKQQRRKGNSTFIKSTDVLRIKGGIDRPMLVIVILLLCFGSVMVFSASYAYALDKHKDSYYFIKRQLAFAAVGLVAMFVVMRIDYQLIRKLAIPIFLASFILLAIVPIYGATVGVAMRWINIPGIGVRFQPSEIMKLSLVVFLAMYFSTFQDVITDYSDFRRSSIWGMLIPFSIVALVCLLVALEMHFSGTIIMFMIGMIVIFVGGARKFWFILCGGMAGTVILFAILFVDYAKERIDIWLHPENYSSIDETWQTIQGLIAIGSGGFLGVGLGNSRQKHMFVSQPQNDFIFTIICEELGFVGALMVVLLFVLFIWRGFVIALRAPDTFSSLVVVGIISKIGLQAILNIGVVTNMIPNTGITLPFFSYGGTALMMILGEMGIVLSISRFSYQQK